MKLRKEHSNILSGFCIIFCTIYIINKIKNEIFINNRRDNIIMYVNICQIIQFIFQK